MASNIGRWICEETQMRMICSRRTGWKSNGIARRSRAAEPITFLMIVACDNSEGNTFSPQSNLYSIKLNEKHLSSDPKPFPHLLFL
jgi:hypothetical protein